MMGGLQNLFYLALVNSWSSLSTLLPFEQQEPECLLLKLPVDILKLINEYLPFSGRVCIRLTCLAIYNLLESPAKSIEKGERMKCLALICRDQPDCWLAQTTPYVRHVLESDMPNLPKGRPASEDPFWSLEAIHLFERNTMMIEAKHVQLAIKYSQLKTKTCQQARYLKLLLEPYDTTFKTGCTLDPLDEAMELCYFQWYPKVVSGRYLTYSQRSFIHPWGNEPVELCKLGCFGACMHQVTGPKRYEHFLARQRRAMWERFMDEETPPTHQRERPSRSHPECSDPFYECLRNAYYMHGIWFDGACPWCLTEFSVCVKKSGDLVVNTWRDLGDVDTPLNHDWWEHAGYESHMGSVRSDIEKDRWEIRTRYGLVGGRWDIF